MKFSELSTDKALDVMCELTPHIANIVEDDQIVSALSDIMPKKQEDDQAEQDGFSVGLHMMGGLSKMAPVLLKTHRDDVYNILSTLNEKTVQEIAAQPIMDTIKQIRDVFQDIGLLNFFKSFGRQDETEQSAPSVDSPD